MPERLQCARHWTGHRGYTMWNKNRRHLCPCGIASSWENDINGIITQINVVLNCDQVL